MGEGVGRLERVLGRVVYNTLGGIPASSLSGDVLYDRAIIVQYLQLQFIQIVVMCS